MSRRLYDFGDNEKRGFGDFCRNRVRALVEPLIHELMDMGADRFDLYYMISQQAALATSHKHVLMDLERRKREERENLGRDCSPSWDED